MEILGISPTEFLLVLIILVLVLGPSDLIQLGRKTGRLLRRIRESETWILVSNLSRALRNLPATLAEETRADEIFRDVATSTRPRAGDSVFERERYPDENRIRPPGADAFSEWTTPASSGEGPVPAPVPDQDQAPEPAAEETGAATQEPSRDGGT